MKICSPTKSHISRGKYDYFDGEQYYTMNIKLNKLVVHILVKNYLNIKPKKLKTVISLIYYKPDIQKIYIHCQQIKKIICTSFRNRKKSQQMQRNCIFTDKVKILGLSYNVKKSKTIAILSENRWNQYHSNRFQWRLLLSLHLYCYRFLLLNYMNQVPVVGGQIFI